MTVMSRRSPVIRSYLAIASLTTSGEILPCLERPDSTATATLSLSTSKKRRSASLVSERPKPSVPSRVTSPPMYFSISCGYAMMLSEAKTVTPSKPPRHSCTYGMPFGSSGCRREWRSTLTASRCSSPMFVALQTSQAMPYSSSIFFAPRHCCMMEPVPIRRTVCCLSGWASSHLYRPFSRPSLKLGSSGGAGIEWFSLYTEM
mmetsp:Transcript_91010/g.234977  ORF Transcript_91010/g.234977 Transcript_91010/m.234977 type:complete len:203 (+) Transcript_91010:370-978(+)